MSQAKKTTKTTNQPGNQPVKFTGKVTVSEAKSALKPVIQERAKSLGVKTSKPDTHLKAGSSTTPSTRYNLRSSKPNAFQKIKPENIIAVTKGHKQEVEAGMIEALKDLNISANATRDKGQKPPFVQMDGNVYYYLAEKQAARK